MITPRQFVDPRKPKKSKLTRGGIKPVSAKRVKINRIYASLREAYLKAHPYDQVVILLMGGVEEDIIKGNGVTFTPDERPVYWPRANEIHHRKHRGKYLLDITTWYSVRSDTHKWIHDNPKESYLHGFLLTRN